MYYRLTNEKGAQILAKLKTLSVPEEELIEREKHLESDDGK